MACDVPCLQIHGVAMGLSFRGGGSLISSSQSDIFFFLPILAWLVESNFLIHPSKKIIFHSGNGTTVSNRMNTIAKWEVNEQHIYGMNTSLSLCVCLDVPASVVHSIVISLCTVAGLAYSQSSREGAVYCVWSIAWWARPSVPLCPHHNAGNNSFCTCWLTMSRISKQISQNKGNYCRDVARKTSRSR